jgi:hypothetical protein
LPGAPGELWQYAHAQDFKHCPFPEEARNGDVAAIVQGAPFCGVGFEARPIRGEVCQLKFANAALEPLADLAVNLAEAWPVQVELRQRPVQKLYAI